MFWDIPVWRGYFLFGTLLGCIWTSYLFPVVVCVHVCVLGRVPVCVYGRACICTCTLVCTRVVVHCMLECIMMYAGLWCWMLAWLLVVSCVCVRVCVCLECLLVVCLISTLCTRFGHCCRVLGARPDTLAAFICATRVSSSRDWLETSHASFA